MRKTLNQMVFDTATAEYICRLTCTAYHGDFGWHDTKLYRSPKGQWFLAGEGNAFSMWGKQGHGGGLIPGEGIRLLPEEEVLEVLEAEDMDYVIEEYFEVEEG